MRGRNEQAILAYRFLAEHSRTGDGFTMEDLCQATGWKEATPRAYLSKHRWDGLVERRGALYFAQGVHQLTEEEYLRRTSQVAPADGQLPPIMPTVPRLAPASHALASKAQQAALQAVDTYNRPGRTFRTHAFLVLMTLAWTAALHALFEKRGQAYWYLTRDGEPQVVDGEKKAWELAECLQQHFADANTPERKNLEFLARLRNRVEHRFLPEIDQHISGECQAALLNLEDFIFEHLGSEYCIGESLYIPLQLTRVPASSSALRRYEANNFENLMSWIGDYRSALGDDYSDAKFSFRVYLVPKIGNHVTSSDVSMEFIPFDKDGPDMASLQRAITLIRDRSVQVANQGKLLPKAVAELVSARLGRKFYHTTHHPKAIRLYAEDLQVQGARYRQLDEPHNEWVYTEAWVNFLSERLADPEEFAGLAAVKLGPTP